MKNVFRLDNNYGNIEPLFERILDKKVDCELIKSRAGTYIRTRCSSSNFGASIIEESKNCKSNIPRFDLGVIVWGNHNFDIARGVFISDDETRFLTKEDVFEALDTIERL